MLPNGQTGELWTRMGSGAGLRENQKNINGFKKTFPVSGGRVVKDTAVQKSHIGLG
jgi:hypothetical protein